MDGSEFRGRHRLALSTPYRESRGRVPADVAHWRAPREDAMNRPRFTLPVLSVLAALVLAALAPETPAQGVLQPGDVGIVTSTGFRRLRAAVPQGLPMDDLFIGDKLHMNEKGYKIWQQILLPYLDK